MTPLPPFPPFTVMRARSRNIRHPDARERTDERSDADMSDLIPDLRERGRDADRLDPVCVQTCERAQRIGVQITHQQRAARWQLGEERDQLGELIRPVEDPW